jgi:hypothetical protein
MPAPVSPNYGGTMTRRDRTLLVGTVFVFLSIIIRSAARAYFPGAAQVIEASFWIVLGVAVYFIPPRPMRSFPLYLALLILTAALYAWWDRIWSVLRQLY